LSFGSAHKGGKSNIGTEDVSNIFLGESLDNRVFGGDERSNRDFSFERYKSLGFVNAALFNRVIVGVQTTSAGDL
jgi:hypothetical protein